MTSSTVSLKPILCFKSQHLTTIGLNIFVNVESRTEYLIASVSVIDKNAEMISIGKVRNCREAPRSSGCEGRDFTDFGWDYGDYGIVSLRDKHESPPIDVDIGSTVGNCHCDCA